MPIWAKIWHTTSLGVGDTSRKRITKQIEMQQTSYPRNYVPNNKQKFENPEHFLQRMKIITQQVNYINHWKLVYFGAL